MVMGALRMVEIDGIYPGHHLLSRFRQFYLLATCLLTTDIGKKWPQTLFLLELKTCKVGFSGSDPIRKA